MSAATCRSRCRRRPPRRSCAPASRHAGYHVFSVRARGAFGLKRRKVKLEPFLIFNPQFLTLIRAGLPILTSLQMLGKIQKNAAFAAQLEDVTLRVKTGEALSAAFEAQDAFPPMYTTTLLAGERSGNLNEVLDRYVSFQKVSLSLRKKLLGSLIYPSVLLTLVFGLLVFMFTVVVPQFAALYDQMGSKLPAMTLALLNSGKWTQHNILWIVLGVAAVVRPSIASPLPSVAAISSTPSASACRSWEKSG